MIVNRFFIHDSILFLSGQKWIVRQNLSTPHSQTRCLVEDYLRKSVGKVSKLGDQKRALKRVSSSEVNLAMIECAEISRTCLKSTELS
jgi:hypothetical protein